MKFSGSVFCGALAVAVVFAEEAPALEFEGPEVVKLDWSVRALRVADLNGDGLTDLAVINNDLGKIELLSQTGEEDGPEPLKRQRPGNRWEPVLEDAFFSIEGVDVGFAAFDLAIGDLDGDGLADLAYTAKETPLTIRYQEEDGAWTRQAEFDVFEALGWPGTILVDDLDADGLAELVVMALDALYVFRPDGEGVLAAPAAYPLAGENPFNLLARDVDGDGAKDLVYITANGQQSLVLRLQSADGAFGPELRFPLDRPVRRVADLPGKDEGGVLFASVDARAGTLEFFRLRQAGDESRADAYLKLHPEVYPILKKGRESARYALGDIDGDGWEDLVVSNPGAAELSLFLQNDGHFAPSRGFPSFSKISSLTAGRFLGEKQASVVVISAEEKSLGISRLTDSGRLSFPAEINFGRGDPLVCAAVDPDGDGRDELALLTRESGEYRMFLLRAEKRGRGESDWEVLSEVELPGVRREPVGIRVTDIYGEAGQGMIVLVPREAPVLLRSGRAAPFDFEPFAVDSALRQNLLKDVSESRLSSVDLDGDGVNELVVCRPGYARVVRVVGDGLEMVDQFNARRSDDNVAAAIPLESDDGLERLLFFVSGEGELQTLRRDEDGVLRYQHSLEVGALDLLQWFRLTRPDGAPGPLLFAGEDRFWTLREGGDRWEREIEGRYETDLEDVSYSNLEGADFDGDGGVDLLVVDGKSHLVEILGHDGEFWVSRVFWEVFEQNLHYQGRKGGNFEPRETVTGDFNGDGRHDFAFLVHDRVLVYTRAE